jgi:hypothetical protein
MMETVDDGPERIVRLDDQGVVLKAKSLDVGCRS